jgi:uncharacterized protein YciI
MAEWIYFLHPPRDNFAATMTDEEKQVWAVHLERFERMLAEGTLVLVGPTLGSTNTGIAIFEAPDEEAARRIMEEDPVVAGGYARGELRPFRVSLIRGRDDGTSRDAVHRSQMSGPRPGEARPCEESVGR